MRADEASLARLMAMSQQGDRQAYASLLESCQRWLRGYYARRVTPAQLDDLVQETLIALHTKRASWDSARPFCPGWRQSRAIAGLTICAASTAPTKPRLIPKSPGSTRNQR